MRTVDDVVEIPIIAARGFLKFAIRQPERPGPHRPRLGQHCRSCATALVLMVSPTRRRRSTTLIFGVKCPHCRSARSPHEVDSLDDQGVFPVPAANGVAQIAGWSPFDALARRSG